MNRFSKRSYDIIILYFIMVIYKTLRLYYYDMIGDDFLLNLLFERKLSTTLLCYYKIVLTIFSLNKYNMSYDRSRVLNIEIIE